MIKELADLANKRKEGNLIPSNKYNFIQKVQVELQGPDNKRVPYKIAELCWQVMGKLEEEHRTWAATIHALRMIYHNIEQEGAEHGRQEH